MDYNSVLVQLPLIREQTGVKIRTPEDVYNACKDMTNLAQESFHALLLDVKNNLINRVMVTLGLASASLTHPRETFRSAITHNASSIVCVHSHPSGDPSPSAEDLRVTRQLVEAGRIIDIKVIDHVVMGRDPKFVSMREAGLVKF